MQYASRHKLSKPEFPLIIPKIPIVALVLVLVSGLLNYTGIIVSVGAAPDTLEWLGTNTPIEGRRLGAG